MWSKERAGVPKLSRRGLLLLPVMAMAASLARQRPAFADGPIGDIELNAAGWEVLVGPRAPRVFSNQDRLPEPNRPLSFSEFQVTNITELDPTPVEVDFSVRAIGPEGKDSVTSALMFGTHEAGSQESGSPSQIVVLSFHTDKGWSVAEIGDPGGKMRTVTKFLGIRDPQLDAQLVLQNGRTSIVTPKDREPVAFNLEGDLFRGRVRIGAVVPPESTVTIDKLACRKL